MSCCSLRCCFWEWDRLPPRERLLLLRGNIARVGVAAAATLADVVPLLAIPLAYVFASLSRPRTRVLVGGACLVLVAVACVQMVNHWLGPLPGSGIGPSGFFGILVFRS